jgi:hypothetical protein
MGVGPIIGYRMGINAAEPPNGIKNDIGLAGLPDFGAQLYIPFQPDNNMGLIFEALYANVPYSQKFDDGNSDWTDRFQYLNLGANFHISNFIVGLNMGFPMAANRYYENSDLEIKTDILNNMFELRLGGNFTLNESRTGRMILFVNLGYQINGQYSDESNSAYMPHPASLQLGLGYIINMK